MKNDTASFTAQLNTLKTLKDGGYRLTIDFGQDGLDSAQKLMKWTATGDINLAVVIVPYKETTMVTDNIPLD